MRFLLKIYRAIVPEKVRIKANVICQKLVVIYKNKRAMKKINGGNLNKDKTFYVIRTTQQQGWGPAVACQIVLNNIKYALERGWIPVVDYKNHYVAGIQQESRRGQENAWEYYFEQPIAGYSLDEVYKSRHIVLAPGKGQPYGSLDWKGITDLYEDRYNIYFELTTKYIRFKPEILQQEKRIREEIFKRAEGKKVLGVGMRAAWCLGATNQTYSGHPVGIGIDEYIKNTYKFMEEFGCEFIFISCEDRYYTERMKQEFGEKCLYMRDRTLVRFYDDQGKMIIDPEKISEETRNETVEKRAVDYFIEVMILSACDALYHVQSGGSTLACLLNNKRYENHYLELHGFWK